MRELWFGCTTNASATTTSAAKRMGRGIMAAVVGGWLWLAVFVVLLFERNGDGSVCFFCYFALLLLLV